MNLCERFHCLPDRLLEQDVRFWKLIKIEALGRPRADEEEVFYGE